MSREGCITTHRHHDIGQEGEGQGDVGDRVPLGEGGVLDRVVEQERVMVTHKGCRGN